MLNNHVVLTYLINTTEIMSLNAVCRGSLRLHTDVLAVGGCAEKPSSAGTGDWLLSHIETHPATLVSNTRNISL